MASFNLLNKVKIVNPHASVDFYYGPYTSLSQAKAQVPAEIREKGKTVGIISIDNGESKIEEYWWQTDTNDEDLVLKGGSSDIKPFLRLIEAIVSVDQSNAVEDVREIVRQAVNTLNTPLVILKGSFPILQTIYENEVYRLVLNTDSGNYGSGLSLIQNKEQVIVISKSPLNSGTIGDSVRETVELGNIGNQTIESVVNQGTYEIRDLSEGYTAFRAVQNNRQKLWLYIGNSGTIGVGGQIVEPEDFNDISITRTVIPSLQDVLNVGPLTSAFFPSNVEITDDGEKVSFKKSNSLISISEDRVELNSDQLIIKNSLPENAGQILKVNSNGYFELAVPADTIYDDSDVLKDSDTVSEVTENNKLITEQDYGGLVYIDQWNPSTNTPELTDANISKARNAYICTTTGTLFGIDWEKGDYLVYDVTGDIFREPNPLLGVVSTVGFSNDYEDLDNKPTITTYAEIPEAEITTGTASTLRTITARRLKFATDAIKAFVTNGFIALTGNQTIEGIKTFSSSPIIPAPTTDLQAATKKYVDDNGAISVDSVANVATDTILGRISAGSGESEELTPTQVRGLINVEANADITDTENVRSSGALMDDEVANLGQVKAFDSSDYANAVETTNALNDRVKSVTVSEPNGSDKVVNIVSLTQAEYDAGTPVDDTFYIIT
jgi:hypothetical protein